MLSVDPGSVPEQNFKVLIYGYAIANWVKNYIKK